MEIVLGGGTDYCIFWKYHDPGVVVGIVDQFRFPIKFLGIGEGIDDLKVFDKKEYVESLFRKEDIEN